ncbi:Facilitated trehalose transporter Tret1-2 homolog [Eumeta japonica]|uniref:Facilitated trehalose transporter Tret1-2 homolog n=1 Tax=Eumeta variegata TaxID=151549 RepID=A0A4C1XPZ2_EUMVA|nr:Facilitated trehalose transporter Tret1-2 homolog [Eumeta japonica]
MCGTATLWPTRLLYENGPANRCDICHKDAAHSGRYWIPGAVKQLLHSIKIWCKPNGGVKTILRQFKNYFILHINKEILIGRILHGLSYGMLMPLRSVLIGEYTSPKKRGAFLMLVALAQAFGIFFVHLVGSLMSWQRTALVCVFFSFASLLMTIYAPESPSWLADKGRYEECREVFRWLRGNEESEELEEMIQARILIEKEKIKRTNSSINFGQRIKLLLETLKKREFYIPIILMMHAYFMLQFAGGTTMASYSTKIIDLIVGGRVDVKFWMVFLDCQRLFFNILAVYIIDKVKRRTMMFGTGGLCVVSHLAIALYVYARLNGKLLYDAQWIPLLLINVQFVSVAMGMVPMPSVIAGEVFPLEYRSIGGSISLVALAATMFIALKTFPGLTDMVGIEGTYFLYGVILTYNLVVIWFLLPETKGRTLQQIEDEFRGRPLEPEELEARMSLQSDPVQLYKRKMSARRCSSPLLH